VDATFKGRPYSYRIIVAGDKVVTGYARLSPPGDWVAITGKFDEEMAWDWVEANEACQKYMQDNEAEIVHAVKSLGLNFQGVDVIVDQDGKHLFLEVQPDFSCGNARFGDKPPWFNPSYPKLVKFLHENEVEICERLPMYWDSWLDKNVLFRECFTALKEKLILGDEDA